MKYLFLSLFTIFALIPTASAQAPQRLEVQGLAITPFLIEIEAKPRQTTEHSIVITNTTDAELPISVSVNDFVPTENGQPRFLDSDRFAGEQYSLAKWVTITSQPNYIIPAGGTTKLNFTVTPPENAEPGTHYGGILFSYRFPKDRRSNSQVEQKVGAVILAGFGKGNQQGQITGLYHTVSGQKDIDFSLTFNNNGNTHVIPKGEIAIVNSFGRTIGSSTINRDGLVVLPETQRSFETNWHNDDTLFGRYTFRAVTYFGNPKLEARYEFSAWILPTKLIMIYGAIAITLVLLAIFGIKRYNQYIIKHHRID